ncbi:MAG: tyrosine-protein phosphatase [Coriobacteriia bacterium]|nr:tyrosine-protein phosphatase [Coriobacteriia bacterium]
MEDRRTIALKGVKNARDLGGLEAADGAVVRSRLLMRSGCLHRATSRDVATLRAWGVSKVVDVRTALERQQQPDQDIPGAVNLHLPALSEKTVGITRESGVYKLLDANPPNLVELYATMPAAVAEDGRMTAILQAIMQHDYVSGGVLVHCTAGKDRAGITCALLLSLLGVPRQLIFADYLRSNQNGVHVPRPLKLLMHAANKGEGFTQAVRDALLAKEEYLQSFFTVVDEEYGGVEPYVHDTLGIPEADVAAFRAALLGRRQGAKA